jgi:SPW repeat-containing protein
MKWASWVTCMLGVWLIAAPFTLAYMTESSALYEDVILGFLIASFAFTRAVSTETPSMVYVGLAVAVAGLWVLLAPYFFGYIGVDAAFNNDMVVGSAVCILGIWQAVSSSERHDRRGTVSPG